MRILTAGESHGEYLTAIIEGFPKGVTIRQELINGELSRRRSGFGRGKRMEIEADRIHIVSGLRNKVTLGSPIAMLVRNRDTRIFTDKADGQAMLSVPRPAHADLSGALKYHEHDVRNILERASARETVMRVCVGAACKQFLGIFGIALASYTVRVGSIVSSQKPKGVFDVVGRTRTSKLNCIDRIREERMIKEIERAQHKHDSLGGVAEILIEGVCPGLGSVMHYDKRLDGRLAAALMSVPAAKGVEVGLGFDYAAGRGAHSHDCICYNPKKGFFHTTNNSGGIEGGMSTGAPIIVRLAMKPIATLTRPLDSVNLITKRKEKAIVERTDTCAIAAFGVIAENMCAIILTEAFLEKFGCDTLSEIKRNYRAYIKSIQAF
ncbi:MAG: chorismate synthase [Candidatus Omnitrophota bacterium]